MAIREIVKIGDKILSLKAQDVSEFDDNLKNLLDDLKETMLFAEGVGIAAPQIGISKRICIVCVDGETVYELINPVIVKGSGMQYNIEGCLSVPGRNGYVQRPKKLIVDAYNRDGEMIRYKVSEYLAIAFSHEIDHLEGILFTQKIIDDEEKIKKIKSKAENE